LSGLFNQNTDVKDDFVRLIIMLPTRREKDSNSENDRNNGLRMKSE
jgi:hypothetical protein